MGAPSLPKRQDRERPSLLSFFRSRSLSRGDEVISTRCRPSNSVPPLQSSERNARTSRGQACLQVDKSGSTRAPRPPPEISREELYQFKMQNYIFCPVESSLMPASLSMDGAEERVKGRYCRDEEPTRMTIYQRRTGWCSAHKGKMMMTVLTARVLTARVLSARRSMQMIFTSTRVVSNSNESSLTQLSNSIACYRVQAKLEKRPTMGMLALVSRGQRTQSQVHKRRSY